MPIYKIEGKKNIPKRGCNQCEIPKELIRQHGMINTNGGKSTYKKMAYDAHFTTLLPAEMVSEPVTPRPMHGLMII